MATPSRSCADAYPGIWCDEGTQVALRVHEGRLEGVGQRIAIERPLREQAMNVIDVLGSEAFGAPRRRDEELASDHRLRRTHHEVAFATRRAKALHAGGRSERQRPVDVDREVCAGAIGPARSDDSGAKPLRANDDVVDAKTLGIEANPVRARCRQDFADKETDLVGGPWFAPNEVDVGGGASGAKRLSQAHAAAQEQRLCVGVSGEPKEERLEQEERPQPASRISLAFSRMSAGASLNDKHFSSARRDFLVTPRWLCAMPSEHQAWESIGFALTARS